MYLYIHACTCTYMHVRISLLNQTPRTKDEGLDDCSLLQRNWKHKHYIMLLGHAQPNYEQNGVKQSARPSPNDTGVAFGRRIIFTHYRLVHITITRRAYTHSITIVLTLKTSFPDL